MAAKDKKPAAKKADETVTRITASKTSSSTPKTAASKKPIQKVSPKTTERDTSKKKNVFRALGDYFVGAWQELKQVNWPNRKATWSLTAALIAFTGFFVALILLLDMLFQKLFEQLLG